MKQVSQSQADYYAFKEAIADRPANNFLRSKGLPLYCINDLHVELYTKAKGMCNSTLIPTADQKLLQRFCRTWLKHSGNLSDTYVKTIQNKINHYGHKIKNKQLRERRLSQKKSV